MTFSEIVNNRKQAEKLRAAVEAGMLHHAYLIEGPATAGKEEFAKSFAQAIMCRKQPGWGCGTCAACRKIKNENHVDLTVIRAEEGKTTKKKSVRDEQIKMLIGRMKTKPYDGDRNIAIITDGDLVTPRAYNTLLKTLEEPPEGTVIMILSENSQVIPVTILSRMVHIRLQEEKSADVGRAMEQADELVSMLADGEPFYKIKRAVAEITKNKGDKKKIYEVLDCMEGIYRDALLKGSRGRMDREYIFKAIKAIEQTRKDIMNDYNTTYFLSNMALTIGG